MAAKLFTILHVFRYEDRIDTNTVYVAATSSAEAESIWRGWLQDTAGADRMEAYIATDYAADMTGAIRIGGAQRESVPVDEFHRWEETACAATEGAPSAAWRHAFHPKRHLHAGLRMSFRALPQPEQERASAMFLGAGQDDGYDYELDIDGRVLCRRKRVA